MESDAIRSFRDLDAWQVAMEVTMCSYELAKGLPATERFELSAQIRKAAVSVPANIAEGQSCGKDGRFLYHLAIAQGSIGELETELEVARRLKFISVGEYAKAQKVLERSGQLIHGLTRSVRRKRAARLAGQVSLVGLLVLPSLLALFR
jgi:four helix bundle protein